MVLLTCGLVRSESTMAAKAASSVFMLSVNSFNFGQHSGGQSSSTSDSYEGRFEWSTCWRCF